MIAVRRADYAKRGPVRPLDSLKRLWNRLRARVANLWARMAARPTDAAAKDRPMSGPTLSSLVIVLGLLFTSMSWLGWTVWNARPLPGPEEAWPTAAGRGVVEGVAPSIEQIDPDTAVYGVARPAVRIIGRGFSPSSTVLVDGIQHPGGRYIAPNQMVLELGDADFRQSGLVALTVTRDNLRSDPFPLRIADGAQVYVAWSPLPRLQTLLAVESRLLLLVLLAGALGGTLAAFNSLSDYRGEGRLTDSWSLYYLLSPVLGGGVALLLYAVVRAGFLAGTDVRIEADAAPWGLVGISALAGFFYDKTLLKLREVFLTLFSPRDERSGKLVPADGARANGKGDLRIVRATLPAATKGSGYNATLEAQGGKPPYSWSVNPDLPGGLVLDPLTGVVSGTPTEAHASRDYDLSVADMERGEATAVATLTVHP
jgi:hypothetical protein